MGPPCCAKARGDAANATAPANTARRPKIKNWLPLYSIGLLINSLVPVHTATRARASGSTYPDRGGFGFHFGSNTRNMKLIRRRLDEPSAGGRGKHPLATAC